VQAPDKDDWKRARARTRARHLMKYLRGTHMLPLILSANGTGILKWWVDAAFAVHPNMQGHSGGGLSLGRGFPIVSSTKQKLNTGSSMESEIVGAEDFMLAICWTRYFMETQGYQVQDNILFRTTRAQFFWKTMEKLHAASIQNTSIFSISLLLIAATYHWSGV
jgi:hypothetical protein